MKQLTYIKTLKDLEKFSGLTSDELWDNGFNLDDWDACFVTNKKLGKSDWLVLRMDSYCCGYEEVEYKDNFYYLVYHA